MQAKHLSWRATVIICLLALSGSCAHGRPDTAETGPARVWILGDSLTEGLYASSEATAFRSLLFRALDEHYGSGITEKYWRRFCTLETLGRRWREKEGSPDLVFIEIGINDVSNTYCTQVPEAEWQARYVALLDDIRERSPEARIVVGTIPWCGWSEEDLNWRRALQYNEWIRAAARARGVAVADLWAATVNRPDGLSSPTQASVFPPAYRGDSFHPNDVGHARIAEAFFQAYVAYYVPGGQG